MISPKARALVEPVQGSGMADEISSALKLLPPGSRLRLGLLVFANMATSLLDLVGVALVGIVSVSLVGFAQPEVSSDSEAFPMNVVSSLGLADDVSGLFFLGLAAAGFLLLKSALGAYLSRKTLLFLARRQALVSGDMTIRLFRQPISTIEHRSSQEIAYSLITGVGAAIVSLLGSGALALAELALLAVLGIALLVLNFWVTVCAIIFFSLLAVFMHLVLGNWARNTSRITATTNYALVQGIQEAHGAFRELTVLNRMDAFTRRLATPILRAATSTATSGFIAQVPKYVYETSLLVAALALGAFEFSQQSPQEAVITVSVFLAAGSRIMPSMLRLQNSLVSIRSSAGLASPTFALFQSLESAPGDSEDHIAPRPSEGFSPTIQLADVTARYPGAPDPALQAINVEIAAGQSVAIVGPTGAGKSTLADVILGILPVEGGSVLVGGEHPLTCIKLWPGSIAYVPQAVSLVVGDVRQNVAIGLDGDEIDDDAIWRSLADVRLDEFLRSEREGLDTEVGERGVRMSGGQRQRLGLARALYSRPRLLVLDEATSALDAETEAAIASTLAGLHGRVTTIVIAHRLTTIKDADLVLYVDQGRITANGDFEQVRAAVPQFDESAKILGL
jgi:ABC-type multidrug transport system fused ATPase/permease subunit